MYLPMQQLHGLGMTFPYWKNEVHLKTVMEQKYMANN